MIVHSICPADPADPGNLQPPLALSHSGGFGASVLLHRGRLASGPGRAAAVTVLLPDWHVRHDDLGGSRRRVREPQELATLGAAGARVGRGALGGLFALWVGWQPEAGLAQKHAGIAGGGAQSPRLHQIVEVGSVAICDDLKTDKNEDLRWTCMP